MVSGFFRHEKVRITQKEFAEILAHCLSMPLSKDSITKTAEDIGFNVESEANTKKLYQELLALNMWVIVRTCEKLLGDVDKRDAYLDIFHRMVYEMHNTVATTEGLKQWMLAIGLKYMEYEKAAGKTEEPGPMWWLARLVNTNIFGETKKDPFVQLYIGANIDSFTKYVDRLVGKVLKKNEIE